MLLRTRITLFISFAFLAIVGTMGWAGDRRQTLVEQQLAGTALVAQMANLSKLIESAHMTGVNRVAEALPIALEAFKKPASEAELRVFFDQMINDDAIARNELLEIVNADGTLVNWSNRSAYPSTAVRAPMLNKVKTAQVTAKTLERAPNGVLWIATTAPVVRDGRTQGAITFAIDAREILQALKVSTGADVYVTDVRNNLIAGTSASTWSMLAQNRIDRDKVANVIRHEGKVYSMLSDYLPDTQSRQNLRFASVRDITEDYAEQQALTDTTLFMVVGMIACVLIGLSLYLRAALAPLSDAIHVLQALARGDTSVMLSSDDNASEIGQIAEAVEVFRAHTVLLSRSALRRSRQRRRQERFIRGHMQSLAGTLDDDDRDAVLRDLQEIEQIAALKVADPTSDKPLAPVESLTLLSATFRQLGGRIGEQYNRLRATVAELREALATKTQFIALQKELQIAQQVQLALMPKQDLFGEHYHVSGTGKPAKEVGGDFLDYFALDERFVGIVIADVSGKGVPAAFFMANARATVRGAARLGDTPADTLARANDLLAAGNDEMLFVTVFYGILDVQTGVLIYANAGHPPPVIMHADGSTSMVPMTYDLALAVAEGFVYRNLEVQLRPGDRLVTYTDGVTEAFDMNGQQYGEPRLIQFLKGKIPQAAQSARELVVLLVDEIMAFQEGAGQADDITTVVATYHSPAGA